MFAKTFMNKVMAVIEGTEMSDDGNHITMSVSARKLLDDLVENNCMDWDEEAPMSIQYHDSVCRKTRTTGKDKSRICLEDILKRLQDATKEGSIELCCFTASLFLPALQKYLKEEQK